jgi:hypothetical protein
MPSGEGGPGPRGPGPERRAARWDHPAAARRARGAENGRPAGRPEKANPLQYQRDNTIRMLTPPPTPQLPAVAPSPIWIASLRDFRVAAVLLAESTLHAEGNAGLC